MDHFNYRGGELYCEDVPLETIAAAVGTPAYVYSQATIERHYRVFDEALEATPHLICYSVKANSNGSVLSTLARQGAGADIVSGGELFRALRAGIPAERVVFSGTGKQADEMAEALDASILLFNVESVAELELLAQVAKERGKRAPVALRVNPDVDPQTHPYIATGLRSSKFGIPLMDAWRAYERALELPSVEVQGIDCHIGSQLTKVEPLIDSMRRVAELAPRLRERGVDLRYLDVGGGLGICYSDEEPPSPRAYGRAIASVAQHFAPASPPRGADGASKLTIICEPGRVIMGNAGVLLTRVLYPKHNQDKRFLVVDAAMNDLLRPALYEAFHRILPLREVPPGEPLGAVDIVGPVCESADFLAKGRPMPQFAGGETLAVMSCGAYGFSMSSTYNSRRRPAEVLVRGDSFAVVRERESLEDLLRGETPPPWFEKDHA